MSLHIDGSLLYLGHTALPSPEFCSTGIADAVRTSLGPRGMDKMISSPNGEVIISNDGATILEQLRVSHPTARMVFESC